MPKTISAPVMDTLATPTEGTRARKHIAVSAMRPPGARASGSFYEFFAGGGMARAGLSAAWTCLFANDIDAKKAKAYAENWGDDALRVADVSTITINDLPGQPDLVWASFPCQDLSLAGAGAGLKGERSGTFWPFWRTMNRLQDDGRTPPLVVLENVCGALTSHDGKDFAAIGTALVDAGYRFGALVIDAVHFVPQSRPRLFIIALHKSAPLPLQLVRAEHDRQWHTPALVTAYEKLSPRVRKDWVWWRLEAPAPRTSVFADLVEERPRGVSWHSAVETRRLLSMMSPLNRAKVRDAMKLGRRAVGGIYKRTRMDGKGDKVQRAEVRFDDIAGCLRTPVGGSSRQTILLVEGKNVRSRLLSPREAARLMGLPDTYKLPENYNEAYHLAGDGLAVPVVRFLSAELLEPLAAAYKELKQAA